MSHRRKLSDSLALAMQCGDFEQVGDDAIAMAVNLEEALDNEIDTCARWIKRALRAERDMRSKAKMAERMEAQAQSLMVARDRAQNAAEKAIEEASQYRARIAELEEAFADQGADLAEVCETAQIRTRMFHAEEEAHLATLERVKDLERELDESYIERDANLTKANAELNQLTHEIINKQQRIAMLVDERDKHMRRASEWQAQVGVLEAALAAARKLPPVEWVTLSEHRALQHERDARAIRAFAAEQREEDVIHRLTMRTLGANLAMAGVCAQWMECLDEASHRGWDTTQEAVTRGDWFHTLSASGVLASKPAP